MTEAMTVFRRSALEDSDCLFRFNEIHLKGADDASDYSLRGQAFAHIKFLYIQRLLDKHVPQDFEEATEAFVQGIAEHQTPQRLIPELRDLWIRHAEHFALDLDRYMTHEERVVGDGVSFAADLVYAHPDALEIRDDKTYWIALTEDEVRATYQARFYAWQASKRWPHFPAYRITFVFVRFGKVVSVVFSPAEIDQMELEVKADVARVQQAMATQSFPATPGPVCRYCELRCPAADQAVTWPIRLNASQATAAAGWLLVAKKSTQSVQKALKAYCATNGPVLVNGVEWDNRPVEERKYPIDRVLEILRTRNLMGAFDDASKDGLTISHSALAKLIKRFPLLAEDLAPICQAKTSYRFSAKAPKTDDHSLGSGDEE